MKEVVFMLINAKFTGLVERVVQSMLRDGIAATKAEAIRIMAYEYSKNNRQLPNYGDETKHLEKASEAVLKKIWDTEEEEKVWSRYY